MPNLSFLKEHFKREGRLAEDQALDILDKTRAILSQEPNFLRLPAPIT
jgi:serine/threonine-protein phosphatase 2B catalytic subunit